MEWLRNNFGILAIILFLFWILSMLMMFNKLLDLIAQKAILERNLIELKTEINTQYILNINMKQTLDEMLIHLKEFQHQHDSLKLELIDCQYFKN